MNIKSPDIPQVVHDADPIQIQKALSVLSSNFANVDKIVRTFAETVPEVGTVVLGKVSNPKAGQLQWNGSKFQGWNGSAWEDLN